MNLSQEHVGSKISAKIKRHTLPTAELLCSLCNEIQGTKMKLLLFVSVLTFGQLVSSQFPIQGLVGQWVEDDSVRTGLNDFLWARGNSCTVS